MKVYFAPQSRAVRTVRLLEEIGMEYDLVHFSLGQKEMRGPEYTKVNPNGRVPTVVDGDTTITEAQRSHSTWVRNTPRNLLPVRTRRILPLIYSGSIMLKG